MCTDVYCGFGVAFGGEGLNKLCCNNAGFSAVVRKNKEESTSIDMERQVIKSKSQVGE